MPPVLHTRALTCGATLVVEEIPGVRSAGVTWLVPGGVCADPDGLEGVSALWSEMLMRGAGSRSSREDADAFDRLGATRSVDNATHHTRFSAACLGERVGDVLGLLADMVLRPRMEEDALEPARELALQSLESLKDDPQERAALGARARHFPSPLNRSGLGTPEGLERATREDVAECWKAWARPTGSIIGVAGAVRVEEVMPRLEALLAGWSGAPPRVVRGASPSRGYAHEGDQSSQVHVVLVHDAPAETHPDAVHEKVVASVLSGGMAGRLFTEVREKRGLCYAVSAGYRGDRDFGAVSAYVGTTPERAQQSLDVLAQELVRINDPARGAVTPEEFERAMTGMKSRLVFSGESTAARAATVASDVFRLGRARSLTELRAEYDRVTLESVNAYAAGRRLGVTTIQTVGPAALTPPAMEGAG